MNSSNTPLKFRSYPKDFRHLTHSRFCGRPPSSFILVDRGTQSKRLKAAIPDGILIIGASAHINITDYVKGWLAGEPHYEETIMDNLSKAVIGLRIFSDPTAALRFSEDSSFSTKIRFIGSKGVSKTTNRP